MDDARRRWRGWASKAVAVMGLVLVAGCGGSAPTPSQTIRQQPFVPHSTINIIVPIPTPKPTPIPEPTWSYAEKGHACQAFEYLSHADSAAAALKQDAASRRWTRVSSDAGSLLTAANSALDELGAFAWRFLPGSRSVAFLVDYADSYVAQASDVRSDLDVGNYVGLELVAEHPVPVVGGTLQENEDALESTFGPC